MIGKTFDNKNSITSNITNNGTLNNTLATSTITGDVTNSGVIENAGSIVGNLSNKASSTITNSGTIYHKSLFEKEGIKLSFNKY